MRELPAGADAVLLDFAADSDPTTAVLAAAGSLRRALDDGRLGTVTDLVPSAETLLVQAESGGGLDVLTVRRVLAHDAPATTIDAPDTMAAGATDDTGADDADSDDLHLPVRYDGPDLEAVAEILEVAADAVVRRHSSIRWRVQFMGFAPGFGYLVPADGDHRGLDRVGRRSDSRTRVPAGSVAIAAGYSAVYPRDSPGGWHLVGTTDAPMWDTHRTPPALLAPGRTVRFDVEGAR